MSAPAAAALGAGCLALAACGSGGRAPDLAAKPSRPRPVKVQLAPIVPCAVPESLVLTGALAADRQAKVSPNGSGKIVRVAVERGARVRRGDVLVVLDSRLTARSAEAAAAEAQLAEAQQALADKECARTRALFEVGALPGAELDRASTQCAAQSLAARAARANRGIASETAADATVRAPFDGVVGDRFVEVGEFVQPFAPLLQLFAVDSLRLDFAVPEESAAALRVGARVAFRVAGLAGEPLPATVRRLSPNVRPETRDLVVEAALPQPHARLRPGMFAVVEVVLGERPGICVAREALRWEGTAPHLFVAAGTAVVEHVVRTGAARGGLVPLLEPLRAGARVVLHPPAALQDGAEIEE